MIYVFAFTFHCIYLSKGFGLVVFLVPLAAPASHKNIPLALSTVMGGGGGIAVGALEIFLPHKTVLSL